MDFKISYKKILKGLQKVQSIIERREVKPILSNILLRAGHGQLEINATNLEVSIKEKMGAEVIREGEIVVDARKTYELIREMPDKEIYFKRKENNWVEIFTENIFFSVVGLDPKEFPEISFLEENNFQEFNRKNLRDMIEKTIYAASSDETRPSLNGVFFEKINKNEKEALRMVATDGHRLSVVEKHMEDEGGARASLEFIETGAIFPKKGLLEVKKLLEEETDSPTLKIFCTKNSGVFKKENIALAIRIIDEEFPNYRQAIPEETKKNISIQKKELLDSIKRISVIAEERSRAINLCFSKGSVEISTLNPVFGEGKETMVVDYQEEDIKLGFNAGYLIDILGSIAGEKVTIKIKDEDSPVIITPENNDEYTCVVMPMEIQE